MTLGTISGADFANATGTFTLGTDPHDLYLNYQTPIATPEPHFVLLIGAIGCGLFLMGRQRLRMRPSME
jgi:hypothetical protein